MSRRYIYIYSLFLLFSCSVMSDSFTAPWTIAHQSPLSMGFSRQEYWSRLPFPSPGDLPNPGIESESLHWQMSSLPVAPPGKARDIYIYTVQFSSVAQCCPTLCNPMDCSMPGFPVHHQLLEPTQTCPW